MKKILIFLFGFFMICNSSFAVDLTMEEKNAFYNEVVAKMFSSIEEGLISRGYPESKVKNLTSTMKSRVNTKELNDMTWPCVKKYDDLTKNTEGIARECFADWLTKFITEDNKDLLEKFENNSF